MKQNETPKFIADINVGKLAKMLRMMGFDTLIFKGADDADMLTLAAAEDRIVLSRDTRLMERRGIARGKIKAILIKSDKAAEQIKQVMETLHIRETPQPFVLCLECNERLVPRTKEEVAGRVPEYVFKTQQEYMECPACCRVYWKGTHWEKMTEKLNKLKKGNE
jgi:uncharacterized protein